MLADDPEEDQSGVEEPRPSDEAPSRFSSAWKKVGMWVPIAASRPAPIAPPVVPLRISTKEYFVGVISQPHSPLSGCSMVLSNQPACCNKYSIEPKRDLSALSESIPTDVLEIHEHLILII